MHANQPCAPRRTGQRGATLLELGIAFAVGGAILSGAFYIGRSLTSSVNLFVDVQRVETRVEALRYAVVNWYRARYCTAGVVHRLPIYVDETISESVCAIDPDDCLAEYLAPALRSAIDNSRLDEGTLRWRVVSTRGATGAFPPPRLYIAWTPPAGLEGQIDAVARHLDAFCDDDDDFESAEACDGQPADEQIVLPLPLQLGNTSDNRLSRLTEWLARNAVDCDADRNGVLDSFCDGTDGNGMIGGAGYILDIDGDGCDDAHPRLPGVLPDGCQTSVPIDRNEDGRLDLDVTLDLVVNATDFHALGC